MLVLLFGSRLVKSTQIYKKGQLLKIQFFHIFISPKSDLEPGVMLSRNTAKILELSGTYALHTNIQTSEHAFQIIRLWVN